MSLMRLDHLLAGDPLGSAPTSEQIERARSLLAAFGFVESDGCFALDETFAWVTVAPADGPWHVTVSTPLPGHLVDPALAALEGLVMEAGLVRLDPLTRGQVSASDWSARARAAREEAMRRGFP